MDQTKEDMFGADVIVVEHASFFLRKYDYAAGPIGKALKHQLLLYVLGLAYKRRPREATSICRTKI